ncbi:MAG: murein transglycosylase domain-containing protein [Aliidiomarina sp.]|uniref:murein transglycosylase domain-containing protein n=1 Tax=Aliidiomarina sp. TaxID=1872439 RepID=UPI0025C4A5D7|nr:murein transglycosylase domain-containing protein [Aliidiomarina sp.]MCH8500413.1 murein transglycosylase domain-containing protein [Aliidiomarina sp.]
MTIQPNALSRLLRSCLMAGLALTLMSCSLSRKEWRSIVEQTGARDYARIIINDRLEPYGGIEGLKNISSIREILEVIAIILEDVWGKDNEELPSEKRYVKYSNDYLARAIIDFEQGYLQVETIDEDAPRTMLQQALILTLLTPKDLTVEDIFTDQQPQLGDEPFLYQQILDHDGEPIRYEWRAERFAQFLINNQFRQRRSDGRLISSVRVSLVDNHLHLRQLQYSDSVLRYANQYRIPPTLVYAVIEVESSFNPYAVSHANALGLMQIVQATAGRDVYERVKGLPGEPTRENLFKPDYNIDIGSAYLYLLDDVYLNQIADPLSRQYAKIAGYNGGSGNVFRAFSSNRDEALRRINSMTPEQVYQHLLRYHPFAETRNYLQKVREAELRYRSA